MLKHFNFSETQTPTHACLYLFTHEKTQHDCASCNIYTYICCPLTVFLTDLEPTTKLNCWLY